MQRGSRVWRLYYGVQVAVFGIAFGVLMGVWWLVKEAWGVDINKSPSLIFTLALLLLKFRAKSVARAACRRAGLWQDPPRGSRTERPLQRAKPRVAPVHSPPPPLDLSQHSRRSSRVMACISATVGLLCVALTAYGWSQRDWDALTTGACGSLLFLIFAAVGVSSILDEVEVEERGLRRRHRGRIIPWASIQGGKIARCVGADGALCSETLSLEDAQGKRLWSERIDNLPPSVRADLFAWLRARAHLHEREADA